MTITEYQAKCFKEYKKSIGFPEDYTYYYGNPINTIVPIETAVGQAMVVGAYPSARYFTVKGIQNIPLFDNDAPFSDECYYDGTRIRRTPSGQELNEATLEQIGLQREQCWVTDLVKVFLFNDDHIKRYKKIGKEDVEEIRSLFMEFGKRSISWLKEEIDIANPKVIILLGSEVIRAILDVSEKEARELMMGEMIKADITWKTSNVICLPHPKFLMKKVSKNPWPLKFEVSIAPRAKEEIRNLLG